MTSTSWSTTKLTIADAYNAFDSTKKPGKGNKKKVVEASSASQQRILVSPLMMQSLGKLFIWPCLALVA